MATQAHPMKLFKHDSNSKIYQCLFNGKKAIVKDGFVPCSQNTKDISQLQTMKEQIANEAKAILKCKMIGIAVPTLYLIDLDKCRITMEYISGLSVQDVLLNNYKDTKTTTELLFDLGVTISKMHKSNISHGCLNTSNILIKEDGFMVLINFGLSCLDSSINNKAKDLCDLQNTFADIHWQIADKFFLILTGYKQWNIACCNLIFEKFNDSKATISTMVNSMLENEKRHSNRLKSTNEITPRKSLIYKNMDEISSKEVNLRNGASKKDTTKPIINIKTLNSEYDNTNKSHVEEKNIFQLRELKLNIKRIDKNNYVSTLSPRSLKLREEKSQDDNKPLKTGPTTPKNISSKSLRWSERNNSNAPKLIEELLLEEENCQPNKQQSPRISVASSYSDDSDGSDGALDCISKKILRSSVRITPNKYTKKPDDRFGDLVDSDETAMIITPSKSKRARRTSVSSSASKKSINSSKSVVLIHKRKHVDQFCESVNLNETEIRNTPPKRSRKTSLSLSTSTKSNTLRKSLRWVERNKNDMSKLIDEFTTDSYDEEENSKSNRKSVDSLYSDESDDSTDTLESIVPRRSLRTSVLTTPSKSNKVEILEFDTPKRERKPVDRFGDPVKFNDMEIKNTPKRTQKTSLMLSTPSKSNTKINTFESLTPKCTRKSVCRYGESMDSKNTEDIDSPENLSNMYINDDNDKDFEVNEWKTPVNKHLRLSMTPTLRSGSKVRRSILQDIPENTEIEVASTPKTPKKTPKAHVKNLKASASKRSDSGARVPCSPLEIARANLHLHAAPKHLPCREVEFKSIHSFLARKIGGELTGSMYISGVPGTGKTATVKRVIDALNSDIIMKHSFKFVEINGLRLANPHQAFSVIWKELSKETVSSSRAQVLLNNYFSGKKVRELSTILLVDEVDHICNRKQDVVYNILDWPSHTGSKVVVITIANTMDLPERVLRGCVTSRMGLTRLVFKPYTFQQLQEIIMNRLIGNSSFDPDAVQLVARKVAAVSGDARRALDVCRRAIDLIKSEDESQLITINHVNQVLNSILSGVRVTAIRQCSLFEQFFLKALRDETTRTGFDHSTIDSIYTQMKSICLLEGEELPNDQQVIMMAYRLRDNGLIFLENKRPDIFRKVSLNVSPEDISYALDKYNI